MQHRRGVYLRWGRRAGGEDGCRAVRHRCLNF
jgi:hypothetical protein